MTSPRTTTTMKRRTHAGRTTDVLVAALLVVAVSIGLMLVPTVASADLSPTPTENTWVTNGSVHAIANANGITYIGGTFTQVGPVGGPMQARNRLAAIDASGAATSWNPDADGWVVALAVSGTTVYAGGAFTQIGGQGRNNIAAIDATTGNPTAWNPNADNAIWALAVSGTTVYAGGQFTNIGGQARSRLAAIDSATGNPTAWNPNADNAIWALAVSGTTVYVGGVFNNIGGQARNFIAAIDATGAATGWNPNPDAPVEALAVSGNTVYAAGVFTQIGGQGRNFIAAIDATTGNPTGWNPNADNAIWALAILDTTVYAGGCFTQIGGQARNYIAAIDATTGNATGWNPDADAEVFTLAVSGTTVYAGGDFTTIGGNPRAHFAQFDDQSPTWFLAEGTTAWGFDCYISIENPNASAVTAQVGYMTDTGLVDGGEVPLPANSQATVNPRDTLGDKDFSTQVECKEGKTIAVDRTMSWTGPGAPSPDGHCSVGVTGADTTWYLAEGSSAWGFECWLLIQNPNATEATAEVTYMIEGDAPQTFEKKIPAQSRKTYNMADDIGAKDASIKVTANIPVIPERAMYRNNRRSGHDSIGTTAPALSYFLAEGTTDWGFTTYVLVQNPNDTATDVTVTYMTNSGPEPQAPFNMPANSRKTIRVNDILPGADFSTQVTGSQAIIAERAMYWGEGTDLGEASHDSIGLAAPHTTFYLPDGQAGDGYETYTLVQNPNDADVTVEISYLTPDGTGNVVFEETVTANSRKTFNMGDKGINGRAAVMVTCKTAGAKIMVERAMYWNTRGAGTDTIGGYSD